VDQKKGRFAGRAYQKNNLISIYQGKPHVASPEPAQSKAVIVPLTWKKL